MAEKPALLLLFNTKTWSYIAICQLMFSYILSLYKSQFYGKPSTFCSIINPPLDKLPVSCTYATYSSASYVTLWASKERYKTYGYNWIKTKDTINYWTGS